MRFEWILNVLVYVLLLDIKILIKKPCTSGSKFSVTSRVFKNSVTYVYFLIQIIQLIQFHLISQYFYHSPISQFSQEFKFWREPEPIISQRSQRVLYQIYNYQRQLVRPNHQLFSIYNQSTLVKMPKNMVCQKTFQLSLSGPSTSAPQSLAKHPKKTKQIRKKVSKQSLNYQCSPELAESLYDLLSLVNQQFAKSSSFFGKMHQKAVRSDCKKQRQKIIAPLLPTIYECPKMVEEDMQQIKKGKDETQISSGVQKVW